MYFALNWARAAVDEDPIYWAGVLVWLLGFGIYLPSVFGRGRTDLGKLATALCWLGFVLTGVAHFDARETDVGIPIEWPALNRDVWQGTQGVIWLLWIVGSLAIIASWLGVLGSRAGWLGLCAAMTGVVASWPQREETQRFILIGGTAVVILLSLISLRRGELRRGTSDPGDYEAELIRLCDGSRRTARALIRSEMKRSPNLTRAGATLAAVTRIRHERSPYPPTL